jgi:hypothetical protein
MLVENGLHTRIPAVTSQDQPVSFRSTPNTGVLVAQIPVHPSDELFRTPKGADVDTIFKLLEHFPGALVQHESSTSGDVEGPTSDLIIRGRPAPTLAEYGDIH